jgi:4-amino-4-deoxy-L-arabinose transferase-like glycosyltransferase
VWPPLLATAIALLGIAAARGAFSAVWPFVPRRAPSWLNPNTTAPPHRTRIEPLDWMLAVGLAFAQYAVVDLYRDFYNPENQAIGHDNYAFLSTAVAAASDRWDLYMVDKRPLYGILTAGFAPFFGGDLIHSAVGINMGAMSLTQIPMYMLGRLWGGRTAGLAAGLMLLGTALFYPYAHEISSYPLYMLVSTTVVLAVSWAVLRPSLRSTVWAGLSMGVLTLVQVKNFTFNIPMVGLLGMAIVLDGQGKRLHRALATVGPIAAAVGLLHMHPVEFTPLNVLVMHHREEVNYEIPYEWEETFTPDRRNPSPLSPYLPKFLRGGEIEATSGVMMSPPNSNVIAAFPQDGPAPRWEVVPKTTIPPLRERLSHNLKQAAILAPGLGSILAPLAGLGFLWTILLPASSLRRRWGLPHGWWRAAILLVPLASCFGSFSLKFNLRYIFHAAPTLFVLVGCAVGGAAALMSRRGGGLWQLSNRLVALALGLSVGIALFIRAPLIQKSLDERVLSSAFFRLPPDARQLMGKGYRLVSAYVDTHINADAELYDCTPIALGLYRPFDSRLIRPKNGSERDRLCKKQLATPASANPRFLVLTSIPEFSGPDAVTPVQAAAAGWTLLYGFDMHEPRELRDPGELSSIGSGWVAVFTDTPSPEQLGHSMLNGQTATTDAMVTGAPTRPNRTAGAPATGNP